MKPYWGVMRPKSWMKNIFVFVPLVFSLQLRNPDKLWTTLIAFVAFCLASSAVYGLNDVCDADKDRRHPVKRLRPVASGAISKRNAVLFAALLAVIGLAAGFAANPATGAFATAFVALNLAYSIWLKRQPLFDCFCIAAGFVLRVYAGGAASGEPVSDWLFLTIVAASLFLAFGKRRGEALKVGDPATREVLRQYDLGFMNGMMFVYAGLAAVFYAMWAMNRGLGMIYTVPLVIFIISRYLLSIHRIDSHGDPSTVLWEDKTLLAAGVFYALMTVALLYYPK